MNFRSKLSWVRPLKLRDRGLQIENLESRELLAADSMISYAWVDVDSGTPDVGYSNNAAGGAIEVEKTDTGRYTIEFEGINAGHTDLGNVQVSAYGDRPTFCSVRNWGTGSSINSSRIAVDCYDVSGNFVDSAFNVSIFFPNNEANFGYAWVTLGSGSTVTYENSDLYVDNLGGNVQVNRSSPGTYSVRFNGIAASHAGAFGGHVQVTPYGASISTKVALWLRDGDDMVAYVTVTDHDGNRVDGPFNVAVIPPGASPEAVGYAWTEFTATEPSIAHAWSHNPSGEGISKTRISEGRYRITFHGIDAAETNRGHVMVSSYGSASNECMLNRWLSFGSDMAVYVDCFDASTGASTDGLFTIMVLPLPGDDIIPGDINRDGEVTATDIDALCHAVGTSSSSADLDGDGRVDTDDLEHLIHDILGTHYGDANLDGVFNSSDMIAIFAAGKFETGAPATWAQGDFNCDGVFDTTDLIVALADGGYLRT